MSDVQFDDQGSPSYSYQMGDENPGGLTGLVMKTGIAKTVSQANVVLIIIMIVLASITIYLFFFFGPEKVKFTPTDKTRIRAMKIVPNLK